MHVQCLSAIIGALDHPVPELIFNDPRYAFKVLFVEQSTSRAGNADQVIEFVRAGSEAAVEIDRVVFKDRERPKYKPSQIVAVMKKRGFAWFNMNHHTTVRDLYDAKNPKNGFGVQLADNQWYYYENWIDKVAEHCAAEQR